jgi:23S rRNA (adenine2503-C2)-methyltransferase
MEKRNLKEMSERELVEFFNEMGLPAFRARQFEHWIYEKYAQSIDDITEFSKDLRESLEKIAHISNLELIDKRTSTDGTEKYLFRLEDGLSIESVLIPDEKRRTICLSSQVGCAMGCMFCLTGIMGLKRNLKAYEIVDQVIAASRLVMPERITNIVLMGMGEPLHNLEEVSEALRRINKFMKFSGRRITVSTAGLVPEMLELPGMAPDVNIAVSLNATIDRVRSKIMPVNKRYPIKVLLDACRKYPLKRRRRITFEYVIFDGVNDTESDAKRLVSLLRGIPSKVNLIPFNELEDCGFKRPSEEKVLAFQNILIRGGPTALIRKSKGQDIMAACGQLSGVHEKVKRKALNSPPP